ncbi:MAG TPA: neutral zinc metallopeptidase [Fimbriiglobus sp.]|nr:neutral zinc metallopeptidase [Fimbriiglobus sp.]
MRWQGSGVEGGDVEDRRNMRPVAVGGGIVGVIIVLVGAYFGADLRPLAKQFEGGGKMEQVGPPVNDETLKFSKAVMGLNNAIWTEQFRQNGYGVFEKPTMVLFAEQVSTGGCGTAPSAVGPFYCPADKKVYLDPTFFNELERTLGGSKAEFSQAYVIAHEVGHHVQNLLGYNALEKKFQSREGKNATVRLELQADYLAGVWAHHCQQQYDILEQGDVEEAIKSAKSIGDDRIQKKSQGWVSPEGFTHGSSEARVRWFNDGLKSGDASKRKLDAFFNSELGKLDPLLR